MNLERIIIIEDKFRLNVNTIFLKIYSKNFF